MNSFLTKLRLKWFITTKTLGYTSDYLEMTYKIYLNHTKVIHFRDGYPVYSLSTPALYSKPAANFFARSLFRSIQNRNTPNMMSFAVNDICNVRCKHCSFFEGVDDKTRKPLTLEQSKRMIREAQDLGVSVINIVGGEPTLYPELPKLLQSVDKSLSATVMFTNGSLLEEQAEVLKKSGLDSVYVSIDFATAEKHDKFRRSEGLFDKAMRGIRKAKSAGLSTGISCVITPQTFQDGEFRRIIELGKRVGVHEILIFDAMPTGRYKLRKDLVDNNDWVEQMIDDSKKFNSDPSYPGVLLWAYATSHRSVGCSCGTSYFYISPYGDLMSCDFNHAKFGNVLEEPLYKIWDKLSNMPDFEKAKWGGCKIKDSAFRNRPTVYAGNGCSG